MKLKEKGLKLFGKKTVKKEKVRIIKGLIIAIFIINSVICQQPPTVKTIILPFFTLVAKTFRGGNGYDYLNFLRQHLARIGIDVIIIIQDWPTFISELIVFKDFDICYVDFSGVGADLDFTGIYNENDSLNLFGYDTSMDWDEDLGTGLNEWYLEQGILIMPPYSAERVQHYWNWEQYLMDKICPIIPGFISKTYISSWSNLKGYNYSSGIRQSWGKLSFDGSHRGQLNTNELVICDFAWSELNPLFQDDNASEYISDACLDNLIWCDNDRSIWPNLADSYTYLNDTTIQIHIRNDIKWAEDPEGLFPDEKLDIEDVYFTLYCLKTISPDSKTWNWIRTLEKNDQYTMTIYIDGDTTIDENQVYAPSLSHLSTAKILPEHYLNQTQLPDGTTPEITHTSWEKFSKNCFGTGPFEISNFLEGIETVLSIREDYWGLDKTITSDPALNWEERWGFGAQFDTKGLTQQRIRIVPNNKITLLEYKAGRVDLIDITNFPLEREEITDNLDFSIQSDITSKFGFFGFNMRETRLIVGGRSQSPRDPTITRGLAIRKAISYAVDRQEINNAVHGSEYYINNWPINPKMGIWCNPNIIRYNHDLDKAIEYMYKAGFSSFNYNYSQSAFISSSGNEIIYFGIISVIAISFNILKNKRKKLVK